MSAKVRMAVFSVVVCIAAAWFSTGCGGGSSGNADLNPSIAATDGKYFVYGKVIDGATLKPVSGATVKLFTGSIEQSSVTKSNVDANAAVSTESGDFLIANVAGGDHRLRVEASGYAIYEKWISIEQSSDNVYYFAAGSEGEIKLGYSCDVTAYVTSEGAPIKGATVYADSPGSPEISAATDETGKATLAGLSQVDKYSIIAPAFDSNSDSIYDYVTGVNSNYSCADSDKTVAIDLTKAERDDSIYIIGGSYEKYKYPIAWNHNGIKNGEPMVMVFNYPVEITEGGFNLTYTRDLVPSSDSQFGKTIAAGLTANLSGGGTILTITPTEQLFPNEYYTFNGVVTAKIYGDTGYFSSFNDWYVIGDGLLSESIAADNYNGTTGEAIITGKVYIEFPEYVYGNILIKSVTKAGTTQALNQFVDVSNGWNNEFVNDSNSFGCTNGVCKGDNVRYRVDTGFVSADNQASSENSITALIDVTNSEGVRIAKEMKLYVE